MRTQSLSYKRFQISNSIFKFEMAIALCATLLFPALFAAQANETSQQNEKAQKEVERRQELERKSLALLDEVVSGAWSLKLPENRLSVLASAADLLWERDEKRARALFWDALNNLNLIINPVGNDAGAKNPASQTTQKPQKLEKYYEAFGLRKAFLHSVGRRDPQLALDMLRLTRLTLPEQSKNKLRWAPDERCLPSSLLTH